LVVGPFTLADFNSVIQLKLFLNIFPIIFFVVSQHPHKKSVEYTSVSSLGTLQIESIFEIGMTHFGDKHFLSVFVVVLAHNEHGAQKYNQDQAEHCSRDLTGAFPFEGPLDRVDVAFIQDVVLGHHRDELDDVDGKRIVHNFVDCGVVLCLIDVTRTNDSLGAISQEH